MLRRIRHARFQDTPCLHRHLEVTTNQAACRLKRVGHAHLIHGRDFRQEVRPQVPHGHDGDPRHFFLFVPGVGSPVLLFGRCGETAICVVRERGPRVPVV